MYRCESVHVLWFTDAHSCRFRFMYGSGRSADLSAAAQRDARGGCWEKGVCLRVWRSAVACSAVAVTSLESLFVSAFPTNHHTPFFPPCFVFFFFFFVALSLSHVTSVFISWSCFLLHSVFPVTLFLRCSSSLLFHLLHAESLVCAWMRKQSLCNIN